MSYLLTLFDKTPRRIRVVEGTLQAKRTVTNLFWSQCYGLLPYLGADRHLKRATYDTWLQSQVAKGNLIIDQQMAWLTPQGLSVKQAWQTEHYQPQFGQWTWLANWQQLANRVLLALQLVSEYQHHNRRFAPLPVSFKDKVAVRQWFLQQSSLIGQELLNELTSYLTVLEKADPRLADLFVFQLIGHETAGWTEAEAARRLAVARQDLFWMERDMWLFLAHSLWQQTGTLAALVQPLLAPSPLPKSVQTTVEAWQRGYSLAEISRFRHLKIGTVREHLLQATILVPEQVPVMKVLPPQIVARFAEQYQGSALTWQFQAQTNDPGLEFFYFRLLQIKAAQTVGKEGEDEFGSHR